MNAIEITGLQKSFGQNRVLDGLSLNVREGSVFGFIGQNGAGKTTTMKLILGLMKADGGGVSVFGEPVRYGRTPTNRMIGYLPDVPAFYGYMRPMEYLSLCGEICGMERRAIKENSARLLELVGLQGCNRRIGGFSRGMKQRLGIAQALLPEPRLLICDEPTSALDPAGRKDILDILERVKGRTTVLFSTHVLSDVERICDTVAVLHRGRIALSGPLSEIKGKHRQEVLNVEFADSAAALRFSELLRESGINGEVREGRVTIRTEDLPRTESEALALLASHRLLPTRLEISEPTLESLFLEAIS